MPGQNNIGSGKHWEKIGDNYVHSASVYSDEAKYVT